MTRFRPGLLAVVAAAFWLMFVLLGLSMATSPDLWWSGRTLGLIILVGGLYWMWRELETVDVGSDGVVVRRLFRKRAFPREAFSGETRLAAEGIVNQLSVPCLETIDGELLQFQSLRAFTDEKVEDVQRAILGALGDGGQTDRS